MNVNEITKSLQLISKLLNTKPEVFLNFFIDVGFDVIQKTDEKLLDYLKKALQDFQGKVESKKS